MKYGHFVLTGLLTLVGCSNEAEYDEQLPSEFYDDAAAEGEYHDPYPRYVVAGDRLDFDPQAPPYFEGNFEIEGRALGDRRDLKNNAFFISISDYEPLTAAGVKRFGISVALGHGAPKISVGVYELVPYGVLDPEATDLPAILVHMATVANKNRLTPGLMQPDIQRLRSGSGLAAPEDVADHEIVSASLTITHAEDVVLDEYEQAEQAARPATGLQTGEQYVKGTFSFAVKKLGPGGGDYGPETFTFALLNRWAYFPNPPVR